MPVASCLHRAPQEPNGIDVLVRLLDRHELGAAVIPKELLGQVTPHPAEYWSKPKSHIGTPAEELGKLAPIITGPNGLEGANSTTHSQVSNFHWDEALPPGIALNILRDVPNGKQHRCVYISTQHVDSILINDEAYPEELARYLAALVDPKTVVSARQRPGDGILFHSEHTHLFRDNGLWTRFAPPGGPHLGHQQQVSRGPQITRERTEPAVFLSM